MTKEEILSAIEATIKPNNQKGITAESLANILTEIVNASGGSGGSGGISGYYFDLAADDSGVSTPDAMAHNAEVYAQVYDRISQPNVPFISLYDETLFGSFLPMVIGVEGDSIIAQAAYITGFDPATFNLYGMSITMAIAQDGSVTFLE